MVSSYSSEAIKNRKLMELERGTKSNSIMVAFIVCVLAMVFKSVSPGQPAIPALKAAAVLGPAT